MKNLKRISSQRQGDQLRHGICHFISPSQTFTRPTTHVDFLVQGISNDSTGALMMQDVQLRTDRFIKLF